MKRQPGFQIGLVVGVGCGFAGFGAARRQRGTKEKDQGSGIFHSFFVYSLVMLFTQT